MLHDLIKDDVCDALKRAAEERKGLRYRECCKNLLQSRRIGWPHREWVDAS